MPVGSDFAVLLLGCEQFALTLQRCAFFMLAALGMALKIGWDGASG
tara:strand:- start:566 stop:703 length:138 start_codon:yes stop_codon:yes gene_type:complete